ncbi:MAG: hypothetical protein J7496_13760 [Novosphingobium sp.]|nr:hypothetical protein [Novosphingobium sp.]MBO9603563.1 hypothetical protein [Novosphingobium sp.]
MPASDPPNSNKPGRWPAYLRVPPFLPVPRRARVDGWTPERQARFLGHLAETGCVAEAARRAGMSAGAAYRLRRDPEGASFAHAWDVVRAVWSGSAIPVRKVPFRELPELALTGPLAVRMRRGRFVASERKPSDPAALRFLKRMRAAYPGRRGAAR